MTDCFDGLIEGALAREGGYVFHQSDPGGETIWGVTVGVARENGFAGPMRAMTRDQAKAIYRAKYWVRPGLHLIAPLSVKVAEELFDTGINTGTGTAAIFFQRSLNSLNRQGKDYADVAVDGGIGRQSADAFAALLKVRGAPGEAVMLKALNCLQGARYIEIAEGRAASEDFVFGWLANRVAA